MSICVLKRADLEERSWDTDASSCRKLKSSPSSASGEGRWAGSTHTGGPAPGRTASGITLLGHCSCWQRPGAPVLSLLGDSFQEGPKDRLRQRFLVGTSLNPFPQPPFEHAWHQALDKQPPGCRTHSVASSSSVAITVSKDMYCSCSTSMDPASCFLMTDQGGGLGIHSTLHH